MRALIFALAVVVGGAASAQALLRYLGDRPGGGSASSGTCRAPLPTTAAWYGDSIIEGACSGASPAVRLQQMKPGWTAFNKGVSGETSSQIVARYFAGRDTACNGDLCGTYLFEGGVNDLKGGTGNPAAVLATMLTAVDDCRSRGRHCVWSNIMPFRACNFCGDTSAGWVLVQQYNALWTAACAARPDIRCVQVGAGSVFEEPATDGYLTAAFSCDGIHLVQAGTDAFVVLAKAGLDQLLEGSCQ
jgi:hypothetical protein